MLFVSEYAVHKKPASLPSRDRPDSASQSKNFTDNLHTVQHSRHFGEAAEPARETTDRDDRRGPTDITHGRLHHRRSDIMTPGTGRLQRRQALRLGMQCRSDVMKGGFTSQGKLQAQCDWRLQCHQSIPATRKHI